MPETYNDSIRFMGLEQIEEAGKLLLAIAEQGWPERFKDESRVRLITDSEDGSVYVMQNWSEQAVMLKGGVPVLLLACEFCDRDTLSSELQMVQVWEVCPSCVEEAKSAKREQ